MRLHHLLAAAVIAIATPASADSEVKAGDIVDFFVKSANMGTARGICIGTADECAGPAKPSGMDMLINFELDSADLTAQAQSNLEEFAAALKDERLRAARFVVEGHTDASGGEGYNNALSERRAESVTSFLLERGVRADKVTAIGLGKSSPRADDPFDPVNRRVEMRIDLQ